jgi:hypothetical protein
MIVIKVRLPTASFFLQKIAEICTIFHCVARCCKLTDKRNRFLYFVITETSKQIPDSQYYTTHPGALQERTLTTEWLAHTREIHRQGMHDAQAEGVPMPREYGNLPSRVVPRKTCGCNAKNSVAEASRNN